jgi:hypothetical protein
MIVVALLCVEPPSVCATIENVYAVFGVRPDSTCDPEPLAVVVNTTDDPWSKSYRLMTPLEVVGGAQLTRISVDDCTKRVGAVSPAGAPSVVWIVDAGLEVHPATVQASTVTLYDDTGVRAPIVTFREGPDAFAVPLTNTLYEITPLALDGRFQVTITDVPPVTVVSVGGCTPSGGACDVRVYNGALIAQAVEVQHRTRRPSP